MAALIAAVATVALLSIFGSDGDAVDGPITSRSPSEPAVEPTGTPEPDRSQDPARFATTEGVNREGGYTFAFPPQWPSEVAGSVSTVTSPRSDVVVTFGYGPPGDIDAAARDLEDLIRSSYDGARAGPVRVTEIGGEDAITFGGSARNTEGARMTFDVFIIDTEGEDNHAITVFSQAQVATSLDAVIEEIVESFAATSSG